MMLRCWQEHPLERPTFTEIREEFEGIMSQGETYVTFDIDEDSNYFLAPSFDSVPSKHDEDDAYDDEDDAYGDDTATEPTIAGVVVHSQKS